MTDEQINAAIAEACGIRKFNRHDNVGWMYKTNEGWKTDCPNYCNDLNAMHEAEKVLNSDHIFQKYYLALYETTLSTRWPVCATARQRAEAFLRTLGKWEEE